MTTRHDLLVAFGKRLRASRERRGLTIDELAALQNFPARNVYRYERGEVLPQIDRLVAIARRLRVSPAWLTFGETALPLPTAELPEPPEPVSSLDAEGGER